MPKLSDHALAVLERRFLLRDEHGQVAEDRGLPAFDQDGVSLPRKAGVELIKEAILWMEPQGFDTSNSGRTWAASTLCLPPPMVPPPEFPAWVPEGDKSIPDSAKSMLY